MFVFGEVTEIIVGGLLGVDVVVEGFSGARGIAGLGEAALRLFGVLGSLAGRSFCTC